MSSPHGPAEQKSLLQKHTSPSKPNPLLMNMLRIWAASLRPFTQPSSESDGSTMQERATVLDFTKPAITYTVSLYAEHKTLHNGNGVSRRTTWVSLCCAVHVTDLNVNFYFQFLWPCHFLIDESPSNLNNRPRQNGRHFVDDTFKRIFLNENIRIAIKISPKFVHNGPINNIPALV